MPVRCRREFVDDSFVPFNGTDFFPGPNQVETFLTEHGGPGIQHIGLHTSNITEAVTTLKDNGVTFIDPPSAYYSEVCHCFDYCLWVRYTKVLLCCTVGSTFISWLVAL